MAFLVISLKTTRSTVLSLSIFFDVRYSLTCQAIASPSRSGSVAKIILSESLTASVISFKYFFENESISHIISKLFSGSTEPFLDGRSLICP